jgi:hypothetical protein
VNARALLARLRDHGIEVQADGGELRLRGRGGALPPDLQRAAVQHKPELLALLGGPAELPACPSCGQTDYMPIGSGWRRCWSCTRRWGPAEAPDPGDPPDLARLRELLCIPRRRREGGET